MPWRQLNRTVRHGSRPTGWRPTPYRFGTQLIQEWQPGQILIMDNRRVLHARTACHPDTPRKPRRGSVT
ncbi:TauD/TfdA family dioxygenase [Streptomyces sp. DT193]|uniref:TauD/TfdA family dioxygenase n=1 Tax=Streptomyces sp. DT193 TaxID=3393418 RepID=UPI003CE7D29B